MSALNAHSIVDQLDGASLKLFLAPAGGWLLPRSVNSADLVLQLCDGFATATPNSTTKTPF
jgi:hypothetical protein